MTEYAVLGKDTIKIWIMPYLSVAKRGFVSKFDLVEVVNAPFSGPSGIRSKLSFPLTNILTPASAEEIPDSESNANTPSEYSVRAGYPRRFPSGHSASFGKNCS